MEQIADVFERFYSNLIPALEGSYVVGGESVVEMVARDL